MKGSPIRTTLLMELANTGRQSDQPCAGSGKHHAADGAARMVHVVQVERIADADDQLRRGFADDFLGFFESFVAGHVLQADLVFDASASSNEILSALAQGMSLPFVDLNEYQIDKEVISMVPDDLCRRNQLLPLSIVNGRIAVAMANPKNFAAVDDVSATTGMPVIAMVAMPSQVRDREKRSRP